MEEVLTVSGPLHLAAQFVLAILLAGFVIGWSVGFIMGFHKGVWRRN